MVQQPEHYELIKIYYLEYARNYACRKCQYIARVLNACISLLLVLFSVRRAADDVAIVTSSRRIECTPQDALPLGLLACSAQRWAQNGTEK